MTGHLAPVRIGILLLLAAMVAGPWLAEPGYSSLRHTLSEMAAQGSAGAWLPRAGFVAFGVGVAADALRRMDDRPVAASALVLFGACMVLAAVASHRPIDAARPFDAGQDSWHSVFASGMGFAFVVAAVAFALRETSLGRRIACLGAAAAATLLPAAMAMLPDAAGLWQRVMFLVSFAWLWVILPRASGCDDAPGG